MAFERDRIDGTLAATRLAAEDVQIRRQEAMFVVFLSDSHDIESRVPAPNGAFDADWLTVAKDVLRNLRAMDNEVQRVGAEQWSGTSYPASHYDGELAYVTLRRPQEAVLHYFVLGCNSEWDERFVRTGDRWVRSP